MHKLMCIVLSAVVIALCRAIRVVCLHDVSLMYTCLESALGEREERQANARSTRNIYSLFIPFCSVFCCHNHLLYSHSQGILT
jgi:hypothetical protein